MILGVLAWFYDLVVCGVKNENHDFGKLAGLNPHKCLQIRVGRVWDEKDLILVWLVQTQVPWFWCFGLIFWLGGVWGEKRKSWFCKTGWTKSSQMPPKSCGKSLRAKKELILVWLAQSQVPWFWCFGLIFWLGGVLCQKRKSWFCKAGWNIS